MRLVSRALSVCTLSLTSTEDPTTVPALQPPGQDHVSRPSQTPQIHLTPLIPVDSAYSCLYPQGLLRIILYLEVLHWKQQRVGTQINISRGLREILSSQLLSVTICSKFSLALFKILLMIHTE